MCNVRNVCDVCDVCDVCEDVCDVCDVCIVRKACCARKLCRAMHRQHVQLIVEDEARLAAGEREDETLVEARLHVLVRLGAEACLRPICNRQCH